MTTLSIPERISIKRDLSRALQNCVLVDIGLRNQIINGLIAQVDDVSTVEELRDVLIGSIESTDSALRFELKGDTRERSVADAFCDGVLTAVQEMNNRLGRVIEGREQICELGIDRKYLNKETKIY